MTSQSWLPRKAMPMGNSDRRPPAHAQRRIDERRRGLGTGAGERGDYAGDDARATRRVQRNCADTHVFNLHRVVGTNRGTITLTT